MKDKTAPLSFLGSSRGVCETKSVNTVNVARDRYTVRGTTDEFFGLINRRTVKTLSC